MRNIENTGASTKTEVIPVRVKPAEVDSKINELQVDLAAQKKRLDNVEASSLGD